MYGSNYAEIAAITVPVMKRYCDKQGYEFRELLLEGGGNDYAFKKHEFFTELFKEDINVIWYLDVDAIITNLTTPIAGFLMQEFSFYLTRDFNELNGGSVIIRNTGKGRLINTFVLDYKNDFENEQNLYNDKKFIEIIYGEYAVLPHPSINSYRYDLYPECSSYVGKRELGDWHEGDFVLHVPGLSIEKRIEVLKSAKIIE